jgi:hypothetical protein
MAYFISKAVSVMTIRNHQFFVGVVNVPVPESGRPEGCPESIEIDLGTLTVSWEVDDVFDLASAKVAKHAANAAWWVNHPGVTVTVGGQSVVLSVQKTDVAVNRLEILSATHEQRAARIFDVNGLPVTVAFADIQTAASAATAAIEAELTKFYITQAAIESAADQAAIDAVTIPV